jgi:uncharacterized membrane protein
MRRIIGIALIVVLTALSTLAEQTRDQLWQAYQKYTSPFITKLPRGATRMPMAPRVVVVLVRTLREAESRQMPTLNALRMRGADVTLELTPPNYRQPATLGLISGSKPEVYGLTSNGYPRVLPDTLFDTLQTITRTVAIIGSSDWTDRYERAGLRILQPDDPDRAARDGQAIELALSAMRDPNQPASFVLIELGLLEDVAITDPASYVTAAAATDFRIKTLVDALDFNTSVVMIVSDRGLTQLFHDGGDEANVARVPMVLAGVGVAAGTEAIAPQASVAPTLAALSGAPIPMQAQAGPIFAVLAPNPDLVQASAQQLTTFYERWSEVMAVSRFASELMRTYTPSLANGDTVAYLKWNAELNARAETVVAERLAAERTARLPFVIGAGLMAFALLIVLLNSQPLQPLIGAAVYFVGWLVLFGVARGDAFTLSLFPTGDPGPPSAELARNSALLMGAVCIFVALATAQHEDVFDAMTTVLCTLGVIALVNTLIYVWFYWQWGDAWTWTLPNSNALVFTMAALTQIGAFTLTVAPEFPDMPIALLVAIGAAVVFGLVHRRFERS